MVNLNQSLSLRLADGREKTFATAAEMAEWMACQHAQQASTRKSRKPKPRPARKATRAETKEQDGPPLARLVRRLKK